MMAISIVVLVIVIACVAHYYERKEEKEEQEMLHHLSPEARLWFIYKGDPDMVAWHKRTAKAMDDARAERATMGWCERHHRDEVARRDAELTGAAGWMLG